MAKKVEGYIKLQIPAGKALGFLTAGSHASGHYDYSCCNE